MKVVAVEAWVFARWNFALYVAACVVTFTFAASDIPMIG